MPNRKRRPWRRQGGGSVNGRKKGFTHHDSMGSKLVMQQIDSAANGKHPKTRPMKLGRLTHLPYEPIAREPSIEHAVSAKEMAMLESGAFAQFYPTVLLEGCQAWDNQVYKPGDPNCPVCRGRTLKPGHYCLRCDNSPCKL